MNIPEQVAIHEAGHLVVGLLIGIEELGVRFVPSGDEAARAYFSDTDPAKSLRRSLGGLLAQLIVLPGSLESHLRGAYEHSIIFMPDHPHYSTVTDEERDFLSGAHTDMALARGYAARLYPESTDGALVYLREAEAEIRALLTDHADDVSRIAADIQAWAVEPDREEEVMPAYPPQRARRLIRTA